MAFESVLEAVFVKSPLGSSPKSPTENLRRYLSEAVLPTMLHGSSAPPMPPDGHKAHLNRLAIRPEDYRSRFVKIVAPKDKKNFDTLVLEFMDTLPHTNINLPVADDGAGYAFTLPAESFGIRPPPIPRPTNVHEVAPWVLNLPLQTMARSLHVAFPETRKWDITYVNRGDQDAPLWSTLVWRRTPPPSDIKTFFKNPRDPLENCSVIFAIQPPWIMTPQDFKSFAKCSCLPPYNPWDETANRPFTSAQRVWAKLWDTCVRLLCHHWVLSTYWGWAFGAFSAGFTAGQILAIKSYDSENPSVLECLVHHVASSMNLVKSAKLPQYLETTGQLEWDMNIPEPSGAEQVQPSGSDSEWEGIDEEPSISASISNAYDGHASAWGSEQSNLGRARTRIPWPNARSGCRYVQVHPTKAHELLQWQERVGNSRPVPEREGSPTLSEKSEVSTASMYQAAWRAGSELPEVRVVAHNESSVAGENILQTVVEQGPADELTEENQPT